MLFCDLILSNTIRKLIPPLRPNQKLVYYADGRCRVVEEKETGYLPKTSRKQRRKRRW